MFRNTTLSFQISVIISIALFFGTLIFGGFQAVQQEEISLEQKQREIENLSKHMAASALYPIISDDFVTLENLLMEISGFPNIEKISITNAQGQILSEIKVEENRAVSTFRTQAENVPEINDKLLISNDEYLGSWSPVMLGGEIKGWVYIQTSKKFLAQAITKIWEQAIVAGITIFLIAFFTVKIFLNRRLASLDMATDFSRGIYRATGEQIDNSLGSLELNKLADSLNWVSKKIAEQEHSLNERGSELEESNSRLQERVKELNCIYALSQILSEDQRDVQAKLEAIVDLIPPAWQFPEFTSARIIYHGKEYQSRNFSHTRFCQQSLIYSDDDMIGRVEVCYSQNVGNFDEGPFLKEERRLIDEIAHRLGIFFKRYESELELRISKENLERRVRERTYELELAKEEAIFASKAKTDFLSRMSHELRTPMNAILGFAELIKVEDREQRLTSQQNDFVDEVLKAGHHLLALINEVLDLSQIESDSHKFHIVNLPLEAVLKEVVSMMLPVAMERRVDLELSALIPLVYISADELRFKQIMINLVGNAIKYNHQGGRVAISVIANEFNKIKIVVKDSGMGMEAKLIHKIFEPFERLGQDHTIDGTGIGLAVTKNLVQLMGGEIGVESTPEVGSTFWVIFPGGITQKLVQN